MSNQVFKNKNRVTKETVQRYVPQHVELNKVSQRYESKNLTNGVEIIRPEQLPLDNPRSKRPIMAPAVETNKQEFFAPSIKEPSSSPAHYPDFTTPSWGNDFSTYETMEVDSNEIIDNNEYVDGLGPQQYVESDLQTPVDVGDEIYQSLQEEEYLLLINDVVITKGSIEEIESQTAQFLFGKHELCKGVAISIDDIVVLKRIKIKMGVFLS